MLMDTLAWIQEYNMIEKWDRVIVAISWWKDSLALLDLLVKIRKYFFNNEFEIFAVHVVAEVPDINDISDPLTEYFKKYEWEITPIIKRMQIPKNSRVRKWADEWLTCQWCTYSRRMTFFKMAEELNINKIAYGHHKDDIVDTIMMNIFNGSTMNPMPAFNMMKRWNMAIIRPMVFIREHDIVKYWKIHDLVPINACCPLDWESFRTDVRETIEMLEKRHPRFVDKFFNAYRKKLSLKDDISCAEKKNKKILEDKEKIKKSDFSSENWKKKVDLSFILNNFKTWINFFLAKKVLFLLEDFIKNRTEKKHNILNHVNWFFKKIKINNSKNKEFNVKKFDICLIDFWMNIWSEINWIRPALVVWKNKTASSVWVVPISSFKIESSLEKYDCVIDWNKKNWLRTKSVLKIWQLKNVSKSRFLREKNEVIVKWVVWNTKDILNIKNSIKRYLDI